MYIYTTLSLHTSMQRKRCTYRIPKSALLFKKKNLTCKTKQTMHKMKQRKYKNAIFVKYRCLFIGCYVHVLKTQFNGCSVFVRDTLQGPNLCSIGLDSSLNCPLPRLKINAKVITDKFDRDLAVIFFMHFYEIVWFLSLNRVQIQSD